MSNQNKKVVFSDTVFLLMFYLPFFLAAVGIKNLETPILSGVEAKYITAGLFTASAAIWVGYAVHELYTEYKPKDLQWW
jgi:hypothetical protein